MDRTSQFINDTRFSLSHKMTLVTLAMENDSMQMADAIGVSLHKIDPEIWRHEQLSIDVSEMVEALAKKPIVAWVFRTLFPDQHWMLLKVNSALRDGARDARRKTMRASLQRVLDKLAQEERRAQEVRKLVQR